MANLKDYDYQLSLPVGTEIVEKMNQLIKKLEKINENNLKVKVDLTGYITALEIARDYQKRLIDGVNIKTINNQTILGPGNLEIDYEKVEKMIGNLDNLTTTIKDNIVNSINEVNRLVENLSDSKIDKEEIQSTVDLINLEIGKLKQNIDNLNSSSITKTEFNNVKDKVDTIANNYVKSVSYNETTGLFTFTLQDGSIKTIDTAIEKVVANFEYENMTDDFVVTNLTGMKIQISKNWNAISGLGEFNINYYIDPKHYAGSFNKLCIGYYDETPRENSVCYISNDVQYNYEKRMNVDLYFEIINGEDVTNQELIDWLYSNNAVFIRGEQVIFSGPVLKLVLADGTIQVIPLSDFIPVYTGNNGEQIQININSGNEIEAILKDNSITYEKLSDDVKERIAAGGGGGGSNEPSNNTTCAISVKEIIVDEFSILETDKSPYTHYANVTITSLTDVTKSIELINDNPVLFAKYGFAIASVNGSVVELYSIGKPEEDVTLKFEIYKAYSVWDGTYTEE